ncbi:MAG: signal peptidase I [Thermomicrobiales bacterium]
MEQSIEIEAARRRPARNFAVEIFKTALLAAIIFFGARAVILPYEVEGSSMTPNLRDHERVLVNQTVYYHFDLNDLLNLLPGVDREGERVVYPFHAPERGEIVVLEPPLSSDKPYIKRIVGLPGESIAIRDGRVFVDGVALAEPYLDGISTRCAGDQHCAIDHIPDDHVYVLGDNRGNSTDSRGFGPIHVEDIVGKAWFSNWPLDDFGPLPDYDY